MPDYTSGQYRLTNNIVTEKDTKTHGNWSPGTHQIPLTSDRYRIERGIMKPRRKILSKKVKEAKFQLIKSSYGE